MSCKSVLAKYGTCYRCVLKPGHRGAHKFAISWTTAEEYVPPPPPPTMNEQFERLKSKYPDATAYGIVGDCFTSYKTAKGTLVLPERGGFSVWFTMDLPPGKFNRDKVWVAFDVPPGFPMNPPKDVMTDKDLQMSYGGHNWRGNRTMDKFYGDCQWIFVRLHHWNPVHDSLYTYAMVIKQGFEKIAGRKQEFDREYS